MKNRKSRERGFAPLSPGERALRGPVRQMLKELAEDVSNANAINKMSAGINSKWVLDMKALLWLRAAAFSPDLDVLERRYRACRLSYNGKVPKVVRDFFESGKDEEN